MHARRLRLPSPWMKAYTGCIPISNAHFVFTNINTSICPSFEQPFVFRTLNNNEPKECYRFFSYFFYWTNSTLNEILGFTPDGNFYRDWWRQENYRNLNYIQNVHQNELTFGVNWLLRSRFLDTQCNNAIQCCLSKSRL